jgi:hypothetical protein
MRFATSPPWQVESASFGCCPSGGGGVPLLVLHLPCQLLASCSFAIFVVDPWAVEFVRASPYVLCALVTMVTKVHSGSG